MATQTHLPALNGARHTHFCGSYFNYGFHEDAVAAGAAVAADFGATL
jgi:predicted NAD/FAD-binding protein